MILWRDFRCVTLSVLDARVLAGVCVWLVGGLVKPLVVKALCPSTCPCLSPHLFIWPLPPAHPPARSKLLVGLHFICYYLSDAVHLWAWLPLRVTGGCSRSSNPSGSLLSATAAVRSSLASSVSVWQPPWRSGQEKQKEEKEKGGRNTIKMSRIPTDQSLPTSHVLRLTWLPDKWRLEERRRWKRY